MNKVRESFEKTFGPLKWSSLSSYAAILEWLKEFDIPDVMDHQDIRDLGHQRPISDIAYGSEYPRWAQFKRLEARVNNLERRLSHFKGELGI